MPLSNPAKSFLAAFLILLATAGCGWIKSNVDNSVRTISEPKSRLPFKTKEPENFQCEIVETAGASIRRTRLAKKGNWRRTDYDLGEKGQRAVMRTDKEYVLDVGRNIYAERPALAGNTGAPQFSELTHELLTTGHRGSFEEIGREGSIVKYKAVVNDNDASEVIVYFDETIGLPVKQEFFSISGDARVLEYTVEMINFKPDVDESLFSLPPESHKVLLSEFDQPK